MPGSLIKVTLDRRFGNVEIDERFLKKKLSPEVLGKVTFEQR